MTEVIYVSNDNLLKVNGLRNALAAAGVYLETATVTVTLVDEQGAAVSGETWPLSLAFVAGSDGNYRATLKDTLSITADKKYKAKITADGGVGLRAYWEIPVLTKIRER
jgi:hypothetical protein